jgi:aspartyl-tRNA synthetase
MYPRDPRSFPAPAGSHPASGTTTPAQAALKDKWRTSNDGADTIDFERRRRKGEKPTLPSIEDLIATYGDSPNTSWLDPFWTTWRDSDTAAAIGYATHGHYAVAWGRPLCDDRQLPQVCKAFVAMLESKKLKPIWACIDDATESVLLDKLKWKGVSAVDEQRVNPAHVADAEQEKALMQKVRRAEREGVKVEGVKADEVVGGPLRDEISKRMKDWQEERSGTQVYSADESRSTRCCSPCLTYPLRLRPFDDATHRHYFIARDSKGTLVALVVLAQLSAEHGYQIKYRCVPLLRPTGNY